MENLEALGKAVISHFKNIETVKGGLDLFEYLVKYETVPNDCILRDEYSEYSFKKLMKSIDDKHEDLRTQTV